MTGTPPSADEEWVRSAVGRFEGPLTLYATRRLRDVEAARDVVQETFLRLCTQDRAQVGPHLAEWLFTVCRNRTLDVLRKEGRMARLSEEQLHVVQSPDPSPPDVLERRDDAAHALRLLEALPEGQREVLRLKFQNGFSYREISRITGHSVTNVGYLMHAGIKTIRGRMAAGDRPTPAQA
jgi:RNA polymerase sigma factor (sigma-70 family)